MDPPLPRIMPAERLTQVGFAEFNNTADNRANIGGTIIGAKLFSELFVPLLRMLYDVTPPG